MKKLSRLSSFCMAGALFCVGLISYGFWARAEADGYHVLAMACFVVAFILSEQNNG